MSFMKPFILTISGGPRKDGCSAELLRRFTAGFSARFAHYDAYEKNYAPCTDCRSCREFEGCAGIIIASPVYNMSFPAPMKAIIDRMQRYYSARFFLHKRPPIAKYRPVALLLSAGSKEEDGVLAAQQLKKIFTVTNCELLCQVTLNDTDKNGSISDIETEIAAKAAYYADSAGVITLSSHNS